MSYETLRLEQDARGVATLTLNRPDKHNAMNAVMIAELAHAAETLGADDTVRVVVLTGTGRSFCAGGDLGWMREQMQADPETRGREARQLAMMLQSLNTMQKPLIGKLQGNAFGGGVGLASVCDIVIGVDGLRMGLTETKLGLIPATIGPYVVARMGEGYARRVFMNSRHFSAEEAVTFGILARTVAVDALDAAIEAEVAPYLSCAPGAIAKAKQLARSFGPKLDQEVIDYTIAQLVARWETDEAKDGIAAFFEKRAAPWANG